VFLGWKKYHRVTPPRHGITKIALLTKCEKTERNIQSLNKIADKFEFWILNHCIGSLSRTVNLFSTLSPNLFPAECLEKNVKQSFCFFKMTSSVKFLEIFHTKISCQPTPSCMYGGSTSA
jgi:hypothetical protein